MEKCKKISSLKWVFLPRFIKDFLIVHYNNLLQDFVVRVMSLSFYKGKSLKFIKKVKQVTINYKFHSFLGVGGDKSCGYNLCEFELDGAGPVKCYILRLMPS